MLSKIFGKLRAQKRSVSQTALVHLDLAVDGRNLYVVGDLHGAAGLLRKIEASIVQDMQDSPAILILLGDVVDRGPDSADLLDHLVRLPPAGLTRHVIMGNHEAMFLQFLADTAFAGDWLQFGGRETLGSYGVDPIAFSAANPKRQQQLIDAHIPDQHRIFLANLPAIVTWGSFVFAHASVDFTVPLAEQNETTLLWARSPTPPNSVPEGKTLVHGHFPIEMPRLNAPVINMDVGSYFTNRGCILRIEANGQMRLLEI